jgi:hypothetical protein
MKKKTFLAAGILSIVMLLQQNLLHAQILKKIIENVKQSQQGNKTNSTNQHETIDTTGLSNDLTKVLGAFGKAASDNPNDTSSADLVTKALGNLTGGNGISSADSAAAIKTYKAAKGGSGVYYEQTTTMTTKKTGTTKSVSLMYFTETGEGRAEVNLAAMMGVKNSKAIVQISRLSNPRCGVILDDENKTYSLNVIDTSLINSDATQYKITKLGKETMDGYNCTHAKIVSTSGKRIFASTTTMDVWTSPDVPGYLSLRKMMASQNVTVKMLQELDAAGCGGQVVKIQSKGKDYSMTMELTKAEKKTLPASLFMIPAGYAKSDNNLLISNLVQAGQKQ